MALAPATLSCKIQESWSKAITKPFSARSGGFRRSRSLSHPFASEMPLLWIFWAPSLSLWTYLSFPHTVLAIRVILCLRDIFLLAEDTGSGKTMFVCRP